MSVDRKPRILVENFFSVTQFPDRVLSVSGEVAGFEGFHVSTSRRAPADRWETPETPAWIATDLGGDRSADMVALDRGHSLEGIECQVQTSPDGSSWTTVLTFTPPTATSSTATHVDDGARTGEGAFLQAFPLTTARHWRLRVASAPVVSVVGLWIGRSWRPEYFFDNMEDASGDVFRDENTTGAGWRGSTLTTFIRAGALRIRLSSFSEWEGEGGTQEAFHQHYIRSRPAWMLLDQSRAEDSFLAQIPAGARVAWGIRENNWSYRSAEIPFQEHEPLLFP